MLHGQKGFALSAIAIALLPMLADCAPDRTAQAPVSGICNFAAAQRLVGGSRLGDADAMRLTGATIVRQIAPGDPVTHDLRDNRVTIETDRASGRVVGATCG